MESCIARERLVSSEEMSLSLSFDERLTNEIVDTWCEGGRFLFGWPWLFSSLAISSLIEREGNAAYAVQVRRENTMITVFGTFLSTQGVRRMLSGFSNITWNNSIK